MVKRTIRLVPLVLAIMLVAAHAITGQQPTFKAGTLSVPLYATVIDSQKRLVPDLTESDFEVLDNDKPQPLSFFQNETQPITVVVMLDTSASMTGSLDLLRAAAEQFLLRLLPADKATVGAFNDKVQIASTTFSSNRDGLVADMKSLDYGNGTRLWDGLAAGMDLLRGIEGRRVILVFTDGDDTTSKTSLGTVLDRAQIEEVMIYGIGFRSEYIDPASGRMIRSRPDRSLKRIADETGGGYFEVDKKGDLGSAFTRVAQELHSQYVLGFTPMTLDGKVHKLAVRVKQSGMIARARKSYVATPDKLTAPEKPFR